MNKLESFADIKNWNLNVVKIQDNILIVADRATTQEDNHHGFISKMDLYKFPHKIYNGILSTMYEGADTPYYRGQLIKYADGNFTLFVNSIRININKDEVIFL